MLRIVFIVALAAAAVAITAGSTFAQSGSVTRGSRLAKGICGDCHAVGPSGDSPKTGAPPFRDLTHFEPGRSIDEIFAKGILVGHVGMPSIGLSDQARSDLLAYLRSMQSDAAT